MKFKFIFPIFLGILILNACGTSKKTSTKTPSPMSTSETKPQETISDPGLNLNHMDKSVRPQDDFYGFVNGTWMKTAKIPADKSRWGSFNELAEETDNNSMEILHSLLSESFQDGSEGRKIQSLYQTYMDMDKRNADGIAPLKNDLDKINAIQTISDLQKYMIEATKAGKNTLYGWSVYADLKDSKMNAIYLDEASLGLGRDYYQKINDKNTETIGKYTEYVSSMLYFLGETNTLHAARDIVYLEREMAQAMLTNEEIRDVAKQYNPKTLEDLAKLSKNINLKDYLAQVGVNTKQVIIGEINFFEKFDNLINTKNLPVIKNYLKYHLIADNANFLSQEIDDAQFKFYGKYLKGQQEQRPLDKRAYEVINRTIGEAFGKLYVDKYFPAESKTQMVELVNYLKKSFGTHIQNLTWMSNVTKQKALEKLNKFNVKVAYPDTWKDYSALQIESNAQGGTLYKNLQNIAQWRYQEALDKIGKPVDKTRWGMTPQTVNAYYSPLNNEIVFPAAILQPPFFNPKADAAVNFGGIGAVIGHEITHGFDDSGAQFDGDGNLTDWWTEEDKVNFENVTNALADQYSKYEPVKGVFINGKFTNGENIADLGGVNIAYDALQMYLNDHGNPGAINGFTQNQRFFMSWATVWRTIQKEEALVNQIKTDPHSPGYFRAFGPLINTDAWYDAFMVKEGDKLYIKPTERIKIW